MVKVTSLGAELGSHCVGPPRAGEDDKHRKAVHFLAKRRKVFSTVSQNSRDEEREEGGLC